MTNHLVIRTNLSVACVRLVQAILPAFVVVVTLASLNLALGIPFDEFYVGLAAVAAILSVVILRPTRFDNLSLQMSGARMGIEITFGWCLVFALLLAIGFAIGISDYFARRVLLPWALLTPAFLIVGSLLLQRWMRAVILSQKNQRAVVIAGVNEPATQLAKSISSHPELCMRLEGFFEDRNRERLGLLDDVNLLGKLSELANYVKREKIDIIFVALPIRHIQRVVDLLDDLKDTTASIYFVPDIFVFELIQARTTDIAGLPVVAMCETPFNGYKGILKRITDLSLTFLALIPALPVMLIVAVLIKLTSPGPIIFRQKRYGLDGEEIVVFKFRSMRVVEDGKKVPQAQKDDPRVTMVGRYIRRYSLDELPQLFNVIQGRMSLVGPRPHAVAHNEQYRQLISGYMMRHKVVPGITGLAQVNGCRGETSDLSQMQARVEYDLDYLRQWTPVLDIQILLQTVLQVFRDPNAY